MRRSCVEQRCRDGYRYITQKRMVEKQMKMAAEATEVEEDTT